MSIRVKIASILGAAAMIAAMPAPASSAPTLQAVIVHFHYSYTDLSRLFDLEVKLKQAISKAAVGDFKENQVAFNGSDGDFYLYGPDADRLFNVIGPLLRSTPFMRGSKVEIRYGSQKKGVREVTIASRQ